MSTAQPLPTAVTLDMNTAVPLNGAPPSPSLDLKNASTIPNARIRNLPNPAAGETSAAGALYHGAKMGATLASIPFAATMNAPTLIGSLIGGYAGGKGGQYVAKQAGAGPMGQEVAGDITGAIGGIYGAGGLGKGISGFMDNIKAPFNPTEVMSQLKAGASQQIPLQEIKPTAAANVDPYRTQLLPKMQPGTSTTIEAHGYNPNTSEMTIHFRNGGVYKMSGVPKEVYDQFQNSESQGSFHQNNIKGRYKTDKIGQVKPNRFVPGGKQ
jgi:hypothetical protein